MTVSESQANPVQTVGLSSSGQIRTFCIFLDLPKHVGLRMEGIPLLNVGEVIEFDLLVKDPRDPKRTRKIDGAYYVFRRVLKYASDTRPSLMGLTQYLEWAPVPLKPDNQPNR